MKLRVIKPNQTEVEFNNDLTVFFSYNTPVAANVNGVFVRTSKHHSTTTSKHISQWLDGRKATLVDPEFFNQVTNPEVHVMVLTEDGQLINAICFTDYDEGYNLYMKWCEVHEVNPDTGSNGDESCIIYRMNLTPGCLLF